ncbi:MAG: hypothetical protein M1839_001102 [Geoglossum umbratile]|nr:MAG: hypothetical protein M1839_001102 [Geoglossum umbratile]
MAANQAYITDTILGMRKALGRRQDGSDSEETINAPSNRGNKLKRKAVFVHEGQADLPSGPKVYRKEIEHAGYRRHIVSRNPPRLDEDGDELDEEDVDEEADAAARADNVYGDIRVEEILAPLTSVADLPNHPSLSFPYLSNTLPELAKQASDMVHKEKASLWKAKQLLMKFRGDENWAPCGMMESDNDIALFGPIGIETHNGRPRPQQPPAVAPARDGRRASAGGGSETLNHQAKKLTHASGNGSNDRLVALDRDNRGVTVYGGGQEDIPMADVPKDGTATNEPLAVNADGPQDGPNANLNGAVTHKADLDMEDAQNGEHPSRSKNPTANSTPEDQTSAELDLEAEEELSQPAPHRMTTRAQALATASNTPPHSRSRSPTPNSPLDNWVHPIFLIPESAKPDPDFGLPQAEAIDTRRLLLLYVQKQEEICRGAEQLRDGLLKANRRRKEVWKWAKAEAHVGEMSDGEDWYDKEEWGLEEDLKKGKEEEDDDGGKEGKKTRGRRA